MSTFCPNDQTVHEDAAVTCPSCSGRLTVLHPGTAFYHGRYRVERIVRKNAFSVSALVFEETNPRDEFILREIFPAVEVDLSAKQRF